jgi:hypothetical protein
VISDALPADRSILLAVFSSVGRVRFLDEKHFDACTALSGSGPAFACVFLEALADGGVMMGLPRAEALELAAQTLQGAARMTLTGAHPAQLKDAVTSAYRAAGRAGKVTRTQRPADARSRASSRSRTAACARRSRARSRSRRSARPSSVSPARSRRAQRTRGACTACCRRAKTIANASRLHAFGISVHVVMHTLMHVFARRVSIARRNGSLEQDSQADEVRMAVEWKAYIIAGRDSPDHVSRVQLAFSSCRDSWIAYLSHRPCQM